METILKTKALSKVHMGSTFVDSVSVTIKRGEIYGLVGPNGAGKTTFMKMIMNLVKPTKGHVEIKGNIIQDTDYEYLREIGSIIEAPQFIETLSVYENMKIHADYFGFNNSSRIDDVLKRVEMFDSKDLPVNRCSLGMKQRLAIGRAVLCNPKILLLDEPTNGLDPVGMSEIRTMIRSLARDENIAILISSHILSELEQIVDTVGIMKEGKLVEQLTLREIQARNLEHYVLEVSDVQAAIAFISENLGIQNCAVMNETQIRIYDQTKTYSEWIDELSKGPFEILGLEKEKKTLEDYFMDKTNRGTRNA